MLDRACTGIFAIACLAISTCAHGGAPHFFVPEVEPNDSLLNPQIITPFPALPHGLLALLTVPATLTPGDVDFFQVEFTHLIAAFVATDGGSGNPPSLIALFDSAGTMLDISDVGGILAGNLNPGTYTFAVTAAPDTGFIGNHSQSFSYGLSLSWVVIPTPATTMIFGAGCLLGRSRRR